MTDESRPPLHPLAAFTIIALDGVVGAFEIVDPFALVFTCIGVGVLGFVSTTMVQRNLAKEGWGASIAKGLVMGILAGVPYPIAGTAIGAPLLIWAGVHKWIRLPGSHSRAFLDNPEDEE
jgi:hypothetical protein